MLDICRAVAAASSSKTRRRLWGPCLAGTTADSSEIGWLDAASAAKFPAMKATAKKLHHPTPDIAARVDAIDWMQATADLDAQGCAVLKGLLSSDECAALAALYPDDKNFRSRIVMGRH